MRYTYNHSKRLKESSKNVIDLNTATTAQMEEFLADNGFDIEIAGAFSDRCNKLIISQSRKENKSIAEIVCDRYISYYYEMCYADLAVFEDGKLRFTTSDLCLEEDYNFDESEWWDAWRVDKSFNNRKHILLKFLIKYYYKLV